MAMRRSLAAIGFYEAQTIKLISEKQMIDALPLRPLQNGDVVKVSHPLSEDHAILRPSLVPGLIATAERNVRHGVKSLRFFEMGRVFRHNGGGKARDIESEDLAILLSGPLAPDGWASQPAVASVHDAKAIVAALLPGREVQFVPKERAGFVLGCDVVVGDSTIGVVVRLLPSRERELDFAHPVWLLELDLGKLRKLLGRRQAVEELPQFPGSSRDAAMEVPATLPALQIDQAIRKAGESLLQSFECFDVFTDPTGQKLDESKKSIAYRFVYRAADRTLKTEEIDVAHKKVLDALVQTLGVTFR
jgi:phenylalanyl-tRNA synthetase beta chain